MPLKVLSLSGAMLLAAAVFNAAVAQQRLPPVEKQMAELMASRLGTTSIDAYPQFADGKRNANPGAVPTLETGTESGQHRCYSHFLV